ncbi:flippase [Foetidibacter luteolus]|uniref:flippase n=1 Tax=Foetidibacter luteolus TaxID=2608880 RepID=UPI00129C0C99|nr:flippase [Foetidibacter luteolus]
MSKSRTLTKNFGSLSVIQAANFFIPFITLPFIVRVIGPDKFGVLNFLTAFVVYFTLLINYGFDYTATRKVAQNRHNHSLIEESFSVIFYAKLLLFAVSAALFFVCALFVPQIKENLWVGVFCFAGCFANVFFTNWLFQGMEQLQKATIFNLVAKLLFCVSIFLVIRQKEDYWWFAVLSSLSQVLAGVALFFYAKKRFHLRMIQVPFRKVKETLFTDRMIFISTLMISLYTTSNTVMLGLLKDDADVGIFTAAARIISVVQTLALMPVSQTLFPHIGTAFGTGKPNGLLEVKKVFPVVMFFMFITSLLLFVFAPLIIHVIFGDAFNSSVMVMRIMAINPLIICMSNLMGIQTMLNLKMDKQYFRITCLGAVINIALNLFLTNLYSYTGTAISWAITELCIAAAMAFTLHKYHISVFDRNFFNWKYLVKINRQLLNVFSSKMKLSKN